MNGYVKNRNKSKPTFANINFIGKCNAKCYFCVGNEAMHVNNNYFCLKWQMFSNLDKFLKLCKENDINKLYLTGLNTEPSLYKYIDLFVYFLKSRGFKVGIRTNGLKILNYKGLFNDEVSISIHSLDDSTNKLIGIDTVDLDSLIKNLKGVNHRYAILINRYNKEQVLSLINTLIENDKDLSYIQLRQMCTDYNQDFYEPDIKAFDYVENLIKTCDDFKCIRNLFGNDCYSYKGKEICMWKPLSSDVNSFNYFIDGKISTNYFVIESYNDYEKIN